MNITPATEKPIGTEYNMPSARNAKPMTMEIEEPPVRMALSSEAIFVAELAARAPEGHKPPQISQASLRAIEFDIKLMQEMKTRRLAGESTGNNVEDLAIAYDSVKQNLNENSDNSQKHVKFLNDAFEDITRLFFTQDAQRQHRESLDLFDDGQNPNINKDAAERLKMVIADAERKAALFADSFLKNYKKHGLDAYGIAMSTIKS